MSGGSRPTGSDMTRNGEAPVAAAALYVGSVMHQRMKPVGHRFDYKVFSMLVDIDRLDDADRQSSMFSVNRRNLASFFEADHTGDPTIGLRSYVDGLLTKAGLLEPAARVLLVCYPRILGYVFNPLSVYYAYDCAGQLVAAIYEVRNTFGERHTYVCPVKAGELTEGGLRQTARKVFHVSPFIGMNMRYHFRMLPPGDEIRWRILETDADGPLLSATFAGKQTPLDSKNLVRLTARIPFLTFKIVAGIHWEALKLWIKGMTYIPRPKAPPPVSIVHDSGFVEPAEQR